MYVRFLRPIHLLVLAIAIAIGLPGAHSQSFDANGRPFIGRSGRMLYQNGQQFRMAGSNNYYPMYVSQFMVDNLFATASAANFNTFRVWGFIDIGNADGSNSVDGAHNGIYFHYWNGTEPAFNDGATGLQNLDYVIYEAGQQNLKLIIPFVNNWEQFGGIDQYVRWNNGQFHDQFYTDPTIRQWYKDWINHLLNHVNFYTGVKYKDDATILAWELANEERCTGSGVYPSSGSCTTATVTSWAADVSAYVKSIDSKHLLSAGDEGFYCIEPSSSDFTINCSQGVDTIALAELPGMDILSYHLYPDAWGKTPQWGTQWIQRHIDDSHQLGDRAVGGEWGILDKDIRNPVYHEWENTVLQDDGAGALYWLLSGLQDSGTLYPDFDGFTVYCPTPVCSAFTNFSHQLQHQPFNPSPIADNFPASTPNNTPLTMAVANSAITYQGVPLDLRSLDLDPSTPGRQTTFTDANGTYMTQAGGNVYFAPASTCVSGSISTLYTIKDEAGRLSNVANIVVAVGGIAGQLYNFEDGIDTWTAASFNASAGSTAQSTLFPTSCTHSLQINSTGGGWFGPAQSTPPLPLSTAGVSNLIFDLTTTTAGTSQSVALQFGSDFHWCQTPFGFVNPTTSTTITVNLASLTSSTVNCLGSLPADTSSIQAIWVFFSGGGVYYIDNVRTQ
jgi:mannan endo-1,4-beta-mannosidase